MAKRLPRSFFRRDAVTVARDLLGQRLVRLVDGQRRAGRIVETEAYLGVQDKAAHSVGGRRTARNASMYLDGGHAYVYFTYGMHHCMNIVASHADDPVAVLLRAIEPEEGLDAMREARSGKVALDRLRPTDLASGPAKLCQALAIDRSLDGVDLVAGEDLRIERARHEALNDRQIATAPRVGIAYAEEWTDRPLRFYLRDNPHVSRR